MVRLVLGDIDIHIQYAAGRHLTVEDVEENVVLGQDYHTYDLSTSWLRAFLKYSCSAPTRIISLENPLKGAIFPQEDIVAIGAYAREHDIKMHLDGARLWHVAAEKGVSMKTLCEPFDTVNMCFSKGIGEYQYVERTQASH